MPEKIVVPSVGESITEGVISRWLKKDGDAVRAGEPIFELETEKATTEVSAPADGKLTITAKEGQNVAIGAVVGQIEEAAGAPAGLSPKNTESKVEKDGASTQRPSAPAKTPSEKKEALELSRPAAEPSSAEELLSPAARRLVRETGLDPGQIRGTGRGGRITEEDVQTFLEQKKTSASRLIQEEKKPVHKPAAAPSPLDTPPLSPPDRGGGKEVERRPKETRERMSAIRQRIADRLVAFQKATATLTTFNEADLSGVIALREKYRDRFKEKHGVSLGFMSFFVKAAIEGLRAFPAVNARIDGNEIVYHRYYHIGIAVSTEKGLIVPVLHDADRMSFAEIEKRLAELAQKAREGKIAVSDLQGGTFTITNGGVFGSLLSTPILNPGQTGILGMHAIQKRPVVVNDQVVIRPMMYLAFSYDHRLIDGREAVLFLVRVKECIEDPERLMLEV
jgi:2-oxoglutarate dehydrogenase E2 component (dihydrolipoamide succinyltransferase)